MPIRSRAHDRRPTRRTPALVAVFLGVVGIALGAFAAPAGAHAVLVSSSPAAGAVVADPPPVLELRFSESVSVGLGSVRLFDGDGGPVAVGTPAVSGTGTVRVPVRATLADGTYVVTWRVTSADTHPAAGTFTFDVGQARGSGADDPSILADRLLRDQRGDAVVGAAWAVVRWLAFVGIALLVGGVVGCLVVWPGGAAVRGARRLVTAGWALTLVATLAGFVLRGPYVAGLGPGEVVDVGLWGDVATTRFGAVWLVRLVLVALSGLLLALLWRRGADRTTLPAWWLPVAALVGAGIVASPALSGHAASGDLVALATASSILHVAAMSVWLGGLAVLGLVAFRRDDPDARLPVVERFSPIALGCVVVLVVTGSFQSWRDLRGFDALRSTDFGRILVVKLAVVAVLVVVAWFSREVLARLRSLPGDDGAGSAEPADPDGRRRDWRTLRTTVLVEVVLGVAVLAVTAALVNAAPPSGVVATTGTATAGVTLRSSSVRIEVTATPGRTGANDLHVNVYSLQGTPRDVQELTMDLQLPSRGIPPISVPLRRLGPGHYLSPGLTIPFPGRWQVSARVLVGPVDLESTTGTLAIG